MGNEISRWRNIVKERRKKKSDTHFVSDPLQPGESSTVHKTVGNGNATTANKVPPPVKARTLPKTPETHKIRVRALYTFPGVSADDLAFEKGDILEVDESQNVSEENGWWLAKNTKSGKTGYIPNNYVVRADTVPQTQEWWFEFERHEAEKVLLLPGNKKGTFLIRPAGDGASFVLSILDSAGKGDDLFVKHYRIKNLDDGGFYITPASTFKDLFALIDFYKKNSSGLCCLLTNACPRIRPSLQFRELEVSRDAVKLMSKLGSGCFGEVWKGKFRKVVDVAVKTLKPGSMSSEAFLEEARIMHKLTHHRLVQLMAVVSADEPFYIITELMRNGALLEYLRSDSGKKLKFGQLINMNSQIAEGMAYLESKNYIHRDLRAANILVGECCDVKVADFGLARILNSDVYDAAANVKFPIKWTAPEAANLRKFSIKSDVWSFGVLMFEIITFGKVPYPGQTGNEVLKMVERGDRMSRPVGGLIEVSDFYYDMMLKCWNKQPEERPTFEAIFDFFDNYFINVEPNYRDMDDL